MDVDQRQKLVELGIDMDEAGKRLRGKEELIVKFLKRFLEDTHYQALQEALKQGDVEKAFQEAHDLKGVCGNLFLTDLYQYTSCQVEYLRSDKLEEAREQVPEVGREYERIQKGLREIFGEASKEA